MPQQTLPREDQIDDHYKDRFNNDGVSNYANKGIGEIEDYLADKSGAELSKSGKTDAENLQGAEQAGAGPRIINNVTGKPAKGAGFWNSKFGKLTKKNAPIGLIVSLLLGGSGFMGIFGGPSLLIVHIAEVINEKTNYQHTATSMRARKIFDSKLKGTVTGTFRKKFSSFSENDMKAFRETGINPTVKKQTAITGRYIIESFEYNGKTITAADFKDAFINDIEFQKAYSQAMKIKYGGFWDKIAVKLFTDWKSPRARAFTAEQDTREKKMDEMSNFSKEGRGTKVGLSNTEESDACNRACQDKRRQSADAVGEIVDESDELADELPQVLKEAAETSPASVARTGLKTATSALKITGWIDNTCSVYGMVKAFTLATKLIRNIQYVRFATKFFVTHSMQKATGVDPAVNLTTEDAEFLGGLLTDTYKQEDGSTSTPGTDAFPMRYILHGDTDVDERTTPYLLGGGLVGKLEGLIALIMTVLPGGSLRGADKTCGINNNIAVQGVTLVASVAILFIPGANVAALSAGTVIKGVAGGVIMALAQSIIPGLLANILTGDVIGKDPTGFAAGSMFAVGGIKMHEGLAQRGGLPPATRGQFNKYAAAMAETNAEVAALDRATLSPFDASNPHTVAGSIYTGMIPILYSNKSPLLRAAAIPNALWGGVIRQIFPAASAATPEVKGCENDPDYMMLEGVDVALGPLCDLKFGIDPKYLDEDPIAISDRLAAHKLIDNESGEPIGIYTKFVEECINRNRPYGNTGEDSSGSDGRTCFLKDDNSTTYGDLSSIDSINDRTRADFYVHYMDLREVNIREDGYPPPEGGNSSGDSQQQAGQGGVGGWTDSEMGQSSENIPCAAGTNDVGVQDAFWNGTPVKMRLCAVQDLPSSSQESTPGDPYYIQGADGKALINSRVSGKFVAMVQAIKAAGISVSAVSSFRTMQHQEDLARGNSNRSAVASPGGSKHQSGYAIDFGGMGPISTSSCRTVNGICEPPDANNPLYRWLRDNAKTYCFTQYTNEYWHWEPFGARDPATALDKIRSCAGSTTNASSGGGASGATAPADTEPSGRGWKLKPNTDYSRTPCAGDSTGSVGTVETHTMSGHIMRICPSATTGGVEGVNSLISENVKQLVAAAKASGLTLTGNAFRSVNSQIALRKQNCGGGWQSAPSSSCSPPTAIPGNSMHERGLAIDFKNCSTRSTACYNWLNQNAAQYGLYNLPSEAWHWSTSGG